MHFTEYSTRLAAYAAIVNERDEILLTWFNGGRRPSSAGWSLPGGGVEFDEPVRAAAVREVHEETGYDVVLGGLLADHHFTAAVHDVDGRPFRSQRFVFRAEIVGGTLGTVETDGTTDFARWLPLEEVASLRAVSDIVHVAVAALRGDA